MKKGTLSLLLTLGGTVGVAVTSILAVKCSKKADAKTTKKEKVIAYLPAIGSGVVTGACILGGHKVQHDQIVDLTKQLTIAGAGATYLVANRDNIVRKIRDRIGSEETAKICNEANREAVPMVAERQGPPIIELTKHGNQAFLDAYSGRLFYSSREKVREGLKKINYDCRNDKTVCMNDLYDYWDIERDPEIGDEVLWPTVDSQDADLDGPIDYDIVEIPYDGEYVSAIYIYTRDHYEEA